MIELTDFNLPRAILYLQVREPRSLNIYIYIFHVFFFYSE